MPVRPARVLGFPRVLCVWCVPRVPFARLRRAAGRHCARRRPRSLPQVRKPVLPRDAGRGRRFGAHSGGREFYHGGTARPWAAVRRELRGGPRVTGCGPGWRRLRRAFDGRSTGVRRGGAWPAARWSDRPGDGRGRRAIRLSGACDERGCPAHVEGAGVRRGRKARAKSAGEATRTSRAATHRSDPFRRANRPNRAKQPPVRRSETLSFSCRTAGRLRRRGPVRCTHVRSAACPATRRTASRPDARSGTPRRPRGPRRARGT
ncbi:hypothetical protein SAMN05445871_2715 [Paraburkholderia caballeronis]|uniref:Uncharacterized protein n=1 Tax=Paraburkholderia caballeronis TaxID=416943 RepID=A0A1H7T868_9BURK|nr:hypothetical protein C7403_11379 [Paraburkholderia caballeronis]PXW96788.1 hypothetical protein C7407_11379 [Paraburkholderia caballeronis]RAJ93415.1 hypothetical protein C7409_11379 [Paraburkholderia caballeronis]SEC70744.1 hypothetical protein SAMN05445871_2715 [Paraburkholderia caballeronis]SEL80699.1 hypothetical protein SAMN05192542_11466 [Paraburkholderia caballeronis]